MYAAWINAYSLVAAYSKNATYLSYHYKYSDQVKTLTNQLLNQLSESAIKKDYVIHGLETYEKMKTYNVQAASLMENGNFSQAAILLTSLDFVNARDEFRVEQDKLMDFVLSTQNTNNYLAFVSSTTELVIICVAVVVTLPIILFVFGFAIKKDSINNPNFKHSPTF